MSRHPGFSILLITLLGFAFLARAGAALYWDAKLPEDDPFRFGDSHGYWVLAERIASGRPYEYNSEFAKVFRTPGYPVFLSPLFLVRENPPVVWARLLGCLNGTISVWLAFLIARRLFEESAAWSAGWILVFYPGAIAVSILVLAESLFVPLMLLQIYLFVIGWQAKSTRQFGLCQVGAGFCYGVGCLVRPSWILFVPFALTIALPFCQARRRQLAAAGIMMVVLAITMCPWWIRNYKVTGRFVLTSLQTGTSLYDGLNPTADGSSDMEFAPQRKKQYLRQWREEGKPEREFEYAFNEKMKHEAFNWAARHPAKVLSLAVRKLKRTWSPWPNQNEMGSRWIRWGMAAYFFTVILLLAVGLLKAARSQRFAAVVCILPALYFSLLHMVFVGSIRYRHPPMFLLILLSGVGLALILKRVQPGVASNTVVGKKTQKT